MKKILGILTLLIVVCLFTASWNPAFRTAYNIQNTINWIGLFGILGIGVAFVIITGGIDLSIGSVVGLVGSLLPYLLVAKGWSIPAALAAMAVLSLAIGLAHGLLITKLRLQPFIVTLCGLLIYRGMGRWITGDSTQGFGNEFQGLKSLTGEIPITGDFYLPIPFVIMLVLAAIAAVVLNGTVYGRYLLALGRNEQAARYSGINTDRMVIGAYVISSLLAGLGGVLFALDLNTVQPASSGEFYELYAIAAAVLGGCSLRGGEGSIAGVVIGTAVMRVLGNAISLLGIQDRLEFASIGAVILIAVIVDELVKRMAARRRAAQARQSPPSVTTEKPVATAAGSS